MLAAVFRTWTTTYLSDSNVKSDRLAEDKGSEER